MTGISYAQIELDVNSKAKVCPICENDDVMGGDYCQICGKHIRNYCTDDQCQGSIGLRGNARFCPYCGAETTFFKNGILRAWDDNSNPFEETEYGTIYDADNPPF